MHSDRLFKRSRELTSERVMVLKDLTLVVVAVPVQAFPPHVTLFSESRVKRDRGKGLGLLF